MYFVEKYVVGCCACGGAEKQLDDFRCGFIVTKGLVSLWEAKIGFR